MTNLTLFMLGYTPPDEVTITHLLDFFESAPHLCNVHLNSVPLASGDQTGPLVSLTCLKQLTISGDRPISPLLDHLLIPVGANLQTNLILPHARIEDHFPGSLDNLRNLPNFTQLDLLLDEWQSIVEFTGPNGKVCVHSANSVVDFTVPVLEYIARFDTSTAKQLRIAHNHHLSEDLLRRALLPMKNLCAITISRRKNPPSFIRTLDPDLNQSNALICPKLEEIFLQINRKDACDVDSVERMAAVRASRGAKLKSIRVVNLAELVPMDMSGFV